MNQKTSFTVEQRCRTTVVVLVSLVCYKCFISLVRREVNYSARVYEFGLESRDVHIKSHQNS